MLGPICETWGSHSGVFEDLSCVRCDAVSLGDWLPMFRTFLVLSSLSRFNQHQHNSPSLRPGTNEVVNTTHVSLIGLCMARPRFLEIHSHKIHAICLWFISPQNLTLLFCKRKYWTQKNYLHGNTINYDIITRMPQIPDIQCSADFFNLHYKFSCPDESQLRQKNHQPSKLLNKYVVWTDVSRSTLPTQCQYICLSSTSVVLDLAVQSTPVIECCYLAVW